MNAGVAGYGPEESLALLRFLRDEGYHFDAIVLSLFLENDFSDDLPGHRAARGRRHQLPLPARALPALAPPAEHAHRALRDVPLAGRAASAAPTTTCSAATATAGPRRRSPPSSRRRSASSCCGASRPTTGRDAQLAREGVADALARRSARRPRRSACPSWSSSSPTASSPTASSARASVSPPISRRTTTSGRCAASSPSAPASPVVDVTDALRDGSVNYRAVGHAPLRPRQHRRGSLRGCAPGRDPAARRGALGRGLAWNFSNSRGRRGGALVRRCGVAGGW